jgi:hypothetical protein
MPAEQALTEARRRSGPSYGPGGDGSLAFRARLEESAAFLAPVALIGGLALAGGGYDLTDRHAAGLGVWLVVVALLAVGAAGRALLAKPFYWAGGLVLGLAIWSAISSLWSGSVELSVIEADRVLVYLGVFLAAFLITQTDQRRQRFAEGIGIALAGVVLLALASRLLPHVFDLSAEVASGGRLRYPLGYWNADGMFIAFGVVLLLWMSRRSLTPALRWFAAGALPALLLTLYFTYSRGGLLALIVGAACLLALSHDRLWVLLTLGAGVIGAAPAVIYVQSHAQIANALSESGLVGQGITALLLILAGTALAVALFWGIRRLEAGNGPAVRRALAFSRDGRVLRTTGIAVVAVVVIGGIVFGPTAWDKFSSSEMELPSNLGSHFGELNGAGRHEFFRVAAHAFGEKPLIGHGAGTYQFSWDQLRHVDQAVRDAHSLYLQPLAELGVVGGILVLAMVLTILWTGFAAWRDARGPQRELLAALFTVTLMFAIAATIDWYWQIADVGAIFFLAAGALVAARCGQLLRARGTAEGEQPRRVGLVVAGLAVAWLTALALVGPLLVDREIAASNTAAANQDFPDAVSKAENARSIEPWASRPYVQLGLLAQAQGDYPTAIARLGQAIDREDHNWVLYYLRAKAEHQAGEAAAARTDLAEARRLNPLEVCLGEGFEGCG